MSDNTPQKKSKLKFIMSAIGGGIAFLSTIIGLFVFITGKSDLPSLLSSANIVMQEWNQDEASKIVLSILPVSPFFRFKCFRT